MFSVFSRLSRLLVVVAVSIAAPVEAAKLHAVMVADIHDGSIGLSVRQDVFQWVWEFNRIGEYTDLEVETHLLIDNAFNSERVLNELRDLAVEPDDVVLFAYSGHGYRNESKKSKWPVMFMDWTRSCLDIGTVLDEVAAKGARFSLILADCCNSIYPDHEAPTYRDMIYRGRADHTVENYKQLFCESEGILVISSSNVGEVAYGYSSGGLYTYNFLGVLRRDTKAVQGVTWDSLLAKAYDRVIHKQTPIYEYFPGQGGERVVY